MTVFKAPLGVLIRRPDIGACGFDSHSDYKSNKKRMIIETIREVAGESLLALLTVGIIFASSFFQPEADRTFDDIDNKIKNK
jgi:hypothetical protein